VLPEGRVNARSRL